MTLLLAIKAGGGNWSPEAWRRRFGALHTSGPILMAGAPFDRDAVKYAACWKAEPGLLATLPNLKVIFNLGAGVDALLADPSTPKHAPIVRVVDLDLTKRMTEWVVWHVLDQHRQGPLHRAAQARGEWIGPDQSAAAAVRVGIMGLGEIARDAADVLRRIGFRVSGWSRSKRDIDGMTTYAGTDGLKSFLGTTDILVCLLPLTPDTRGILDRQLIAGLARDGVLKKPVLLNAGRGGLQKEADIVAALDDGSLGHAVLDVFETEPLPPASPLWKHPRLTITPHNAADSDPDEISKYVVAQINAFERGEALKNVVDLTRGY